MTRFESLPERFKNENVRSYYRLLRQKKGTLFFKRLFDLVASFFGILVCLIPFAIIAIIIKCTSKGTVFFRQVRVGLYGKPFKIFKFRTMVMDAQSKGLKITADGDSRITGIGHFLRKTKLDELPQLFNVFLGHMSFVGARPEVQEYVDVYSDEMLATLLLRPGITGPASIEYRDESEILGKSTDPEKDYIEIILPDKMKYNLDYISNLSVGKDIKLIFKTVF